MCTTVIVGKNVSKTGRVIVGHNEDMGGRTLHQQFFVPAAQHAPGERMQGEPGRAAIAQVPETLAHYWSNMLQPAPGSSFDQGFFNEAGVLILSNGGGTSFTGEMSDEALGLKEGGIGFLLRRAVAERARSAREGVEIAVALLTEYGYWGEARNYTIADQNEAWMLNCVKGRHFVAKRIPDDQVMLISNALAIRSVDLADPEHVIASPDLVSYAIATGRYSPANPGDYSDFDFARAYQSDENRTDPMRADRMRIGWREITGVEYTDDLHYPELLSPKAPMGVEEVKAVLRLTNPETYALRGDGKADAFHVSARDISRSHTRESYVMAFKSTPMRSVLWRTTGPQDTGVYVPWFPLTGVIPPGYQWTTLETAREVQFAMRPELISLDYTRAYWSWAVISELVNFNRGLLAGVYGVQQTLEAQFRSIVDELEASLAQVSDDEARETLAEAMLGMVATADRASRKLLKGINRTQIMVNPKVAADAETVEIAVLSRPGFDATAIDPASVLWSLGFTGSKPSMQAPAKPVGHRVSDADGDGLPDMVFTFRAGDVRPFAEPGVKYDSYLRGFEHYVRFVGVAELTFVPPQA